MTKVPNQIERYAATAYLLGPFGGYPAIENSDDPDPLLARTPMAAARMWYWRLGQAERRACVCVVVKGWTDPTCAEFPSYKGPELAFSPVGGWRVLEPSLVLSLQSELGQARQPQSLRSF